MNFKYKKINEQYTKAFINGEQIGHVEKHSNGYWVEVYYQRWFFLPKQKKDIATFIKKRYKRERHKLYSEQRLIDKGYKILG